MALARCRSVIAGACAGPSLKAPSQTTTLRLISTTPALANKRKSKNRQTIAFDELPTSKIGIDGSAAVPLAPWKEFRKEHHAPSPDVLSDEEALYKQAIISGDIPDTALAKQVYLNWKRFPDCIVLTRVGKFYEVSSLVSGLIEQELNVSSHTLRQLYD